MKYSQQIGKVFSDQLDEGSNRTRIVINPSDPDESTREMVLLIEISLRMMLEKVPIEKISLYTKISHASLEYIRCRYLDTVIESGLEMVKQDILTSNTIPPQRTNSTREERAIAKVNIRKRLTYDLPSVEEATSEAEKQIALKREIALNMMLDHASDERIHKYTRLPFMEIEYIRIALLPKAIRDIECKSRAMNESLMGTM